MSERALVEFRDRLRTPPGFRLRFTDPGTGTEAVRDFVLTESPAGVWAAALLSDEPADLLLDLLDEEDARWVWELVSDPEEGLDESGCNRIGRAMLARVADRPWWEASRLISTYVHDRHMFDGLAADRGMPDPLTWTVARLCNWVEFRLLSGQAKESDRHALEARIKAPPPMADGEDGDEWADEELAAEWLDAAGGADLPD